MIRCPCGRCAGNSAGSVFLADCPTRLAINIITNKWAVVVLFALSGKPLRHGELVDLVGGVSSALTA
ncbi:DNA-binding HxlR family transcriptional regulator [Streptomyces sp. SAI-135]|jgi:DNA-binding HxlR family transcriptional regulator|nr:DNA-binding HxlR family transcriptional regulator [Streptomyces sp. SAI-090]MDH6555034.1 DNA-binding HxlR family transcriptional regulator [Streptomyces sp. SAI-041]MDH6580969.1 DNA-binding HxlR family transcriptional regulator [Streptomyces sp. SAI-133]MDH6612975.1 DNA-binding HxlR family transcriptional regulator [Streptomyces sp. SAI-135]